MRTRYTAAIAAAVLIGSTLASTGTADATAPAFPAAGYVLQGAGQVTIAFVMPSITCGSSNEQSLNIGAFGPSNGWEAIATVHCIQGQRQTDLEMFAGQGGQGEGGLGMGKPGHTIEITVSGAHTNSPTITLRDTSVPQSVMTEHLSAPVNVGVGAFADPVLRFPSFTMNATVNSGQPFTSVPHTRQDDERNGTTLIKTGAPSSAGTHFALYFRHH